MLSRVEQVGQRACHCNRCSSLPDAVVNLVEAEWPLDDENVMLNLREHLRLSAITMALLIAQQVTVHRLLL